MMLSSQHCSPVSCVDIWMFVPVNYINNRNAYISTHHHTNIRGYSNSFLNYLANYTQRSRFWKATSSSGSKEIPRILRKQKFLYYFHNSRPLFLVLSQINPVHVLPFHFPLKSILILFCHLFLSLPRWIFTWGFPTKILCAFLSSPYTPYVPPISYSFTWSPE